MAYYAGIVLVSAATFLLELALLRVFAVQQFYHFAFMAISLALLGAGASGSLLAVWPRRFAPTTLCLAFGTTTLGAYLTINYLPFDSFSIAWDDRQVLYLALYFLAVAVPFLFSGLLIGGELMAAGDRAADGHGGSHRVYGANLIGSALGSIASLAVLTAVGGEGAVAVAIVTAAVAGLLFDLAGGQHRRVTPARIATTVLLLTAVAGLVFAPDALALRLSPYKTLSVLLQSLDARHTLTDWDAAARVDVVESPTIHTLPGLSLLSPVGPPPQVGLLLDGDNLMPISALPPDAEQARELARFLPNGLAFRLRPRARTLVIASGTGTDVWLALAAGAERVTAVEENAQVIAVVRERYRRLTGGLYGNSRVDLVNQSGRVYVRRSDLQRFDVVIVALTDTHRPVTSGAYGLTENYLYTGEAFEDYLRAAGEDGVLVVTRWLQTPPSESGRVFGAMVSALAARGFEPGDHLIAYRTLRTMTIMASPRPFTGEEIAATRRFLEEVNFDAVYFPGIHPDALNRFNVLRAPVYHDLFRDILADPAAAAAGYRFNIRPATDDWPFFYHFFKWRQTPEILAGLGQTWQPFGGSGFFVLVALLVLVSVAAVVLIVGPLLLRRGAEKARTSTAVSWWRWRVFSYFAGLGLAFLFVEIPLAQRFILVLDQPVTALAIVLFTILLFSGLGSVTVRRWHLPLGLALLVTLIVLYPLLLRPATAFALGQPAWARLGATVLLLAPLGYLMGLPFAGGLRVVERHDPALVPWAWAINGSFSVISSVLAVLAALTWGFSVVLWLGAVAYAAALLAFRPLFTPPSAPLNAPAVTQVSSYR